MRRMACPLCLLLITCSSSGNTHLSSRWRCLCRRAARSRWGIMKTTSLYRRVELAGPGGVLRIQGTRAPCALYTVANARVVYWSNIRFGS